MASPESPATSDRRPRGRRRLLVLGAAAVLGGGIAAYRRAATAGGDYDHDATELGWGEVEAPSPTTVSTPDGGALAVWDVGSGPTVVLPHCWGCSHEIWVPVARRLVEAGNRVVLYDQRGHGASTRGTAPLSIEMLADDLATVLADRDVHDAVLGGHSMGGMTLMSLATFRPEVLNERVRALVLVATAAANMNARSSQAGKAAAALMGSPAVSAALRSPNGYLFVRGAFGKTADRGQMELTRRLFADCNPAVRAGFLSAMNTMDLMDGISTITLPTTVMVGTRDRLTIPFRAYEIVGVVPGARLVTLQGRGHMLPLEEPETVTDEIIRALKG